MGGASGIWRQERAGDGQPDLEWSFEEGRLSGVRSGDHGVTEADAPFDLLALAIDPASGRVFPPHFRFDPETGRPLQARSGFGAPFGAPDRRPDGLPDLDQGGRAPIPETRTTHAMPAGIVSLFACGAPAALFCLTAQGILFFQRPNGEWAEIERLAPPDLPARAFAVAGLDEGFAGVFGDKLVLCELSGSLPRTVLRTRSVAPGRPCGAPAAIENGGIAFPVSTNGRISIEVFWLGERRWSTIEASGGPNGSDQVFSAPVQVPSQLPDTYWVSERSYILLGSDYGERTCEIRPFPEGVRAVPGPRPLRDGSNTLHVLVETQSHFAYRSLTRSPRTTPLGGPHISAGQQSYFGRTVFETPWDDDPLALPIEAGADRVLLPLAYDQGANGRNLGTLVALVGDGNVVGLFEPSEDRILVATLHWQSGARLIPLRATLPLRSRFDLLVYRTHDRLFVGSGVNAAFHSWELR